MRAAWLLAWAGACTTADDPTTGPPPVLDRCADARPGDLCLIGNIPADLGPGMGAMVGLTDRRIAFGGDAEGLMSADGTTADWRAAIRQTTRGRALPRHRTN